MLNSFTLHSFSFQLISSLHLLYCINSITPAPSPFYPTYHSFPSFTHSSPVISPHFFHPSYLFLHASITRCGDVSSPRHLISTSGSHFVLLLQPSVPPATPFTLPFLHPSSFFNFLLPPPLHLHSSLSNEKLPGHQGSLATAPQGEGGIEVGGGRSRAI